VGGRERSAALLTAVVTPSALPGDIKGMTNNIVFAELSMKAAIGIGTTARYASSDFHTCLMTEEVTEIQEYSQVVGLRVIINNTSLMKHHRFPSDYLHAPAMQTASIVFYFLNFIRYSDDIKYQRGKRLPVGKQLMLNSKD